MINRLRPTSISEAEFLVDGDYVGYLRNGGHPNEVVRWLWSLLPRPFERRLMVGRLSLAQCEIRSKADRVFSGFSYNITGGPDPAIFIARLKFSTPGGISSMYSPYLPLTEFMDLFPEYSDELFKVVADPVDHESEPFLDEDVSFRDIEGEINTMRLIRTHLSAYGCRKCLKRYSGRRQWQDHACLGLPNIVRNHPIDFKSQTTLSDRARTLGGKR